MNRCFVLIALMLVSSVVFSQDKKGILSGPMLGQVEIRTARIWLEAGEDVHSVAIRYWKQGNKTDARTKSVTGQFNRDFKPMQVEIGGLEPDTKYDYTILYNGAESGKGGSFRTKELWQWRKPAPDVHFLAGSCTYFNEPKYDRPGKPYGQDSSIFKTMAGEQADFMLWLGDNWYTREVDYSSEWGLWYRASRDRSHEILQPFLKAMPHYAIWDDHDFGPNDMGASFIYNNLSREIFKNYWANPTYGNGEKGIYTMVSYSDVDLFLLDDRSWRSEDRTPATVNGQPNSEKTMLGREQLNWLKQALRFSRASFKIIVVGSQVLNPVSPFDKLLDYPADYNELMEFLDKEKINGVLFMTGDRHHSEIIRVNRQGNYPLYDITVSPLTSGTHVFGKEERDNPFRIFGLDQKQNYGRISVTGNRGERQLSISFRGLKGEELGKWSVTEKELRQSNQ